MKKISRILAIVLIAAAAMTLTGCAMLDYFSAKKSFDAGDYAAAAEMFELLGDYKDSAEKLNESRYQIGLGMLESGDKKAAMEMFELLGDYSDSRDKYNEARDAFIAENIVGSWRSSEIDVTEDFISGLGEEEDFVKYVKIDKIVMNMTAQFNEDGSVKICCDNESLQESIESQMGALTEGFIAYMEDELKKQAASAGLSLETMYGYYGVDNIRDLLSEILNEDIDTYLITAFDMDELLDLTASMTIEGTYEIVDGSVVLTDGDAQDIGEYDLESGKLTFNGAPESEELQFELIFSKVA